MSATYVGFGFGPIQTGLLLFEAVLSRSFDRFVVAEVDQGLVDAVRAAGSEVAVNIAARDGVHTRRLPRVQLLNPRVPAEREAVIAAISEADELGTAVPSVDLYSAGGEASIAAMLAKGCRVEAGPVRRLGHQRIVYTAENNNFAAEILLEQMKKAAPEASFPGLQLLNTVVGKMSGVVSSPEEMTRLGLAPLVPGYGKCVLVEEFNRILVTKISLPGFRRKIQVFEEKDDLLPFEEAKLYGHNAVHALLGYLARLRGYDVMSRIKGDDRLMALGRQVFLEESGASLIRRHRATGDPLFTEAGWAAYADDLLDRMVNPWLFDRVDRIIRDPARKLAWDDRLFGTMRRALQAGISPRGMALGAAAAVQFALSESAAGGDLRVFLLGLWGEKAADPEQESCLALVEQAVPRLEEWRP